MRLKLPVRNLKFLEAIDISLLSKYCYLVFDNLQQNPWWRYIIININIELCWWDKIKQTKVLQCSKAYNIERRLLQEDVEGEEKWKYLED